MSSDELRQRFNTEQDRFKRWVKEAVEIRKKRGTTMNRGEGQHHLSHIFDELLISPSRKCPKEKGKSTGNSKIGVGIHTNVSHQYIITCHLVLIKITVVHTLRVHYAHAAANLNSGYSKYAKVARVHYFCTIALRTSRAVLTRA